MLDQTMDFLQQFLPCQSTLHLESWDLDSVNHQMTLNVSSTQVFACCPVCNQITHSVHSHYERTLRDLPCVDFCLTILLQVCKFFCRNEACKRRIFTERLPQVAVPWARRTVRFAEHLSSIGLALGGAAAARLSYQINYGSSRNTMLRSIAKLELPETPTPKILGVDDFALRRGHHYGTILVDLEKHQPIVLLPDRKADTLVDLLEEYPGVEIFSRDRSKTYKSAITEGAPNAIQVADRFHLLQNLQEVLEKVFHSNCPALKSVEAVLLPPLKLLSRRHRKRLRKARSLLMSKVPGVVLVDWKTINKTHALKQQGYRVTDIAHHLGIGRRTAYDYLAAPVFPERQPYTRKVPSVIEPYKDYLYQEWMAGRHNSQQLFEEIQQQGFKGCYGTVAYYTRQLHQFNPRDPSNPKARPTRESLNDLPGRGPKPAPAGGITQPKPLTPKSASWLVMRHIDELTEEEEETLTQLSGQPALSEAITLTQSFLLLVRKRLPQYLDNWLELAKSSSLKPFQSFAKGLIDDYAAVKAGLTLEVSNGPVEGLNNKLKMLKRQMYGRAGLDLLNKRLVLAH